MKKSLAVLFSVLAISAIVFFTVIQPKIIAQQEEEKKNTFYQSGIEFMTQGKWLEAIKVFDKTKTIPPTVGSAYFTSEDKRFKESNVLFGYAKSKSDYDTNRLASWDWMKNFDLCG